MINANYVKTHLNFRFQPGGTCRNFVHVHNEGTQDSRERDRCEVVNIRDQILLLFFLICDIFLNCSRHRGFTERSSSMEIMLWLESYSLLHIRNVFTYELHSLCS